MCAFSFLLLLIKFYFMSMSVFPVCTFAHYVLLGALRGQKRVSDSLLPCLKQELHTHSSELL